MTPDTARHALTEEIARVVESVPGVAFLRPGLAERLRSARTRPHTDRERRPTAGIRLSRAGDPGAGGVPWHVEIHLVALGQARALDVARAARRGVEAYMGTLLPAEAAPVRVTVTVTGQV